MAIGKRRWNDNEMTRLNDRATCYYLVRSKVDGTYVEQRIVAVFKEEFDAITAAELDIKSTASDCRDWTPEQLDNKHARYW